MRKPGGIVQERSSPRRVLHQESLLLVEGFPATQTRLRSLFQAENRRIMAAETLSEGISLIQKFAPDVVVISLELEDVSGPRAVEMMAQRAPGTVILALSTTPSVSQAVQAVRRGAWDYFDIESESSGLLTKVSEAFQASRRHRQRNASPRNGAQDHVRRILCQNPSMIGVLDQIRQVAETSATALILGRRVLVKNS